MKASLYQYDETITVLDYEHGDKVEIPDSLVKKYTKTMKEFNEVQEKLREIYDNLE